MSQPTYPSSDVVEAATSVWGASLQPAGCATCKQVFLVESARLGQPCPGCARGKLQPQPVLLRPEAPELLAPFKQSLNSLRPSLDRWVSEVWLRSDDFQTDQLIQRAVPVYWPMWLVDSDVAGNWQAEAGFDYQVKSSQESYGNNGWQTRDVVETRARWEPRAGQMTRHYDNIITPALSDQKQLLQRTGKYQREQATRYQPEQIRGAAVRVPDLSPENAWSLAQGHLHEAAADECRQAAGAQQIRNFSLRASYEPLHWTQMLLPMYVTWYTDDDGRPQLLYLNGQSGVIGGRRLASQRKGWQMAGAVLVAAAVLFLMALCLAGIGLLFAPLVLLGILAGIAALLVACGAIFPAAWPWQWNRNQPEESR